MSTFNNARGFFSLFVDVDERSPDAEISPIYNYNEAIRAAQSLDKKYRHKRAVRLSELGAFRSNNKQRTELLEIWWNSAWNDSREPKARGYGYYVPEVGRKRWVEYEPQLVHGPPDEAYDEEDGQQITDPSGHFSLQESVDNEESAFSDYDDLDSAMTKARELSRDSTRNVTIYEWAQFELDGESRVDTIAFWWNEAFYEAFCARPKARGIGLTYRADGSPVFVRYKPSSPLGDDGETEDDPEQDDESIDAESTDADYVKTHCEDCGKVMPLYEKFEYEYEEEVGRSSGSARFGRSSRRRLSSGGRSSYSSGSSSSYSTGRTYYATRKLVLCEDCYDVRIAADNEAEKWTVGDWLAVIGVALFLIVAGGVVFAMFKT